MSDHTDQPGTDDETVSTGQVTNPAAERAARLVGRAADDRLRIDPSLLAELEAEAARRFPGRSMPTVLTVLITEGAAEAMPKWKNDHKHVTAMVRTYTPPARVSHQAKALAGTARLVSKAAGALYHGAPGMEGVTASLLLRLGLDRSTRKQPVVDPAFTAAEEALSGR